MVQNTGNSVVNSHFKVHGTNSLRVVDASIFRGNFATISDVFFTVHALAERAADLLRETYL